VRGTPCGVPHPTVARVDVQLFGEAFVTLFVIVDPPGMLPIFLALTGALAAAERHRAALVAVALAFA
jgi:multiple antibiotic resistance protein